MTCANEFQELLHQSVERRRSWQANIVPGMLDGWKKAGSLAGWWMCGWVVRWLSHPTLLPGAQEHGGTTTGQLCLPCCSSYSLLAGRTSGCPAHCTRPACCVPLGEGGGLAGRLHKGSRPGLLPGLQVSPLLLSLAVTLPYLHLSVTLHFLQGRVHIACSNREGSLWPGPACFSTFSWPGSDRPCLPPPKLRRSHAVTTLDYPTFPEDARPCYASLLLHVPSPLGSVFPTPLSGKSPLSLLNFVPMLKCPHVLEALCTSLCALHSTVSHQTYIP